MENQVGNTYLEIWYSFNSENNIGDLGAKSIADGFTHLQNVNALTLHIRYFIIKLSLPN